MSTRTAPAAPIAFRCEHCRTTAHVPAKYAGRRGKCPTCHEAVIVPGTRVRSGSRSKPRSSWAPPSERARPERARPKSSSSSEARRRAQKKLRHSCRFCGVVLGRDFHECQAEVRVDEAPENLAADKLDRVLAEKAERGRTTTKANLLLRLPVYFIVASAVIRGVATLAAG